MSKVEFIPQWANGRRFPKGRDAEKEWLANRFYIGNVKLTKDGRLVVYKGYLPNNTAAFALTTTCKWSADQKTLEPVRVRKTPRFTWRRLPNVKKTPRDERFVLEEPLLRHFSECTREINDLNDAQLSEISTKMRKEPWTLCMWRKDALLPTLSPSACLEWIKEADGGIEVEPVILDALGVLVHIHTKQKQNGDMLFGGQFSGEGVRWLMEHEELTHAAPYGLALTRDYRNTMRLLECLKRISESDTVAETRSNGAVPCKPAFDLTEEQRAFAQYVVGHPISMLNAPPGCGKTEMIVWINAHFSRVLNVTFVGSMVESMQNRLGGHQGLAHTIHHVITAAKMGGDPAREWLAQYQVVVVDEASNVDQALLASLLRVLPNACKLVLIGDLEQIFPIDSGCPFHDLVHSEFGARCTFHLTRNLRVDPSFVLLAEANRLIRENSVHAIKFGPPGSALTRRDRPVNAGKMVDTLRSIAVSGGYTSLLDFQIVTMRNDDRRALNKAMEEVAFKVGFLDYRHARASTRLTASMSLWKGKKIMFLKTCKTLVKRAKTYSAVRNGEIVLVKAVSTMKDGDVLLTTHTDKHVLISKHIKGALAPTDIDAAYCITCNKSQGSEWAHVIVWMPANRYPFTREYPYVGFSRARKSCTMVGTHRELEEMCKFRANPRETLLKRLLRDNTLVYRDNEHEVEAPSFDFSQLELAKRNTPGLFPIIVYPPPEKKAKKQRTIASFV